MNMPRRLREGFTTGTAATAAAMAALELLLTGRAPAAVSVPLPPFDENIPRRCLSVSVLESRVAPGEARALVRKDGGDDPDATRHALIEAVVSLCDATGKTSVPMPEGSACSVFIDGGHGVGRVTLPGLPVPVGEAAINPVPRQQIARGVRLTAAALGHIGGIRVLIQVPDGEILARRTLNPRLGIVGGISILGTQGTVKPFSHAAWKATIIQGLEVASAVSCDTVCLSTGRRSERLLAALYPTLPEQAFVQAADFVHFALSEAARRSFKVVVWGCFFGKLVKLAQGHPYTHARSAELDMAALSRRCVEAGAACAEAVSRCVTAGHALELLLADPQGRDVLRGVVTRAAAAAAAFAGRPVRIHFFHLNGEELLRI